MAGNVYAAKIAAEIAAIYSAFQPSDNLYMLNSGLCVTSQLGKDLYMVSDMANASDSAASNASGKMRKVGNDVEHDPHNLQMMMSGKVSSKDMHTQLSSSLTAGCITASTASHKADKNDDSEIKEMAAGEVAARADHSADSPPANLDKSRPSIPNKDRNTYNARICRFLVPPHIKSNESELQALHSSVAAA